VEESGLFWTMAMSQRHFEARPGKGHARFHARDLPLEDFTDFVSSITPGASGKPGHVSFDVHWAGGGMRTRVRDATFDFAGDYVAGPITIDFETMDDGTGVTYTSDPTGQITVGGGVGHERNGRFFDPSEDEHHQRRGARKRTPRHSHWRR
jgi:hypothetical protein